MLGYREPLSLREQDEYLERENISNSKPAFRVAEARYQLMTHMHESLVPGCSESLASALFWRAYDRGGVMAVYNECLDKGCTVAQLFDADDMWRKDDPKPTIESYCNYNPELVKDYLTMLQMKIDAYDGLDSFAQVDDRTKITVYEFETNLMDRIYKYWEECRNQAQARAEQAATEKATSHQ